MELRSPPRPGLALEQKALENEGGMEAAPSSAWGKSRKHLTGSVQC